jgi:hypothetical protein
LSSSVCGGDGLVVERLSDSAEHHLWWAGTGSNRRTFRFSAGRSTN